MNLLHYHLVDVFTTTPFGGNQLAVFLDAADLSDTLMQAIARELNLSEIGIRFAVQQCRLSRAFFHTTG